MQLNTKVFCRFSIVIESATSLFKARLLTLFLLRNCFITEDQAYVRHVRGKIKYSNLFVILKDSDYLCKVVPESPVIGSYHVETRCETFPDFKIRLL